MRTRGRYIGCGVLGVAAIAAALSGTAAAQPVPQINPVYVDDSPAAAEALVRLRELLAAGNVDEGVRVLQGVLDEHADRVVASADDPEVFVSVRSRLCGAIRENAGLLARYRELIGPRAEAALREGRLADAERSMILTCAGYEATLRLAQRAVEDARFETARLMLDQVREHSDAVGEGAARLAGLYGQLARYLDRADVRAAAGAAAARAGVAVGDMDRIAWPSLANARGVSATDALAPLNAAGLISKPLWTVSMGPAAPPPDPSAALQGPKDSLAKAPPPNARELSMLPSAQGDTVFVNDGATITALDRFTLSARWSFSLGAAGGEAPAPDETGRFRGRLDRQNYQGLGGRGEDASCVSVRGRTLIAAMGRASNGGAKDGDDRVVAIDVPTGKVRWLVALHALDGSVSEGVIRGPIEISEGVAVVAVRKIMPERRLVSLALLGLDVRSGAPLWTRPIGSTGQMPWVVQPSGAEAMLLLDGVVYRTDRLGVITAVEAGSGRVIWVRKAGVDTSRNQGESAMAWHIGAPVSDGEGMVALAPDAKHVLRLDRGDGRVLVSRAAGDLGEPAPRYLMRAGPRLAAVDDARVHFVRFSALADGAVESTPPVEDPGIRGRVSLVGDRLLIPIKTGAILVDPGAPQKEPQPVALAETGNVLALENQLVVVDDSHVHSYLLWDVAESLLAGRMKANPKDPDPAVTFAELAYRAGKFDRIGAAVDAAMTALRGAPGLESSNLSRQRLFDSLHAMINHAVEFEDDSGAVGARRPPAGVRAITDGSLLRRLADRLGELARSPDERLAYALASGRLLERGNDAAGAAGQYQTVLDEGVLAAATWHGPAALVRGELEAAARLEVLLKRYGAAVYAAEEATAASELAALGAGAGVEGLEQHAVRYPLSSATPGVWLRIARLHSGEEDTGAFASALDAGLRVARRVAAPKGADVGELAGLLITELRRRQQLMGAAAVLRAVRAGFPGVALTAGGQALDAERLGAELADRLATMLRWPRVGAVRAEAAQAMAGWTIMQPLLRDSGPSVAAGLPLEHEDQIALWTPPVGAGRAEDDAQLVPSWTMTLEGREARLVKLAGDAAYYLVSDGHGDAVVLKVVCGEAGARWTSESSGAMFPDEGVRGIRRAPGAVADAFNTPGGSSASPDDLVIAMDERTVVVVQRGGRAAAVDTETGRTLWKGRTLVARVYDADLAAGVLAVAGDQELGGVGNAAVELRPTVQVIDARTGRATQRIGELGGQPRWVKITESGAALVGLDTSVVCIDLASGQANWSTSGPDKAPIDAAWVFGDQAVLLADNREMYLASVSTGRVRPHALDVPKSHIEGARQLEVFPLTAAADSGFGVATNQGLVLFSGTGELRGADALAGASLMIPARPADGRAVAIETASQGRGTEGLLQFETRQFDTATAAIIEGRPVLLGARPQDLMLIDGRVAVSAGAVTVVISAPAKK